MAKSKIKVEGNTISGTAEDISEALKKVTERLQHKDDSSDDDDEQKPYEIVHASIKEMKCHYGYEIKTGPTAGDKIPTRKGERIIHEDLGNAFAGLRVHLAIADDAFKHIYKELPELDDLKVHAVTNEYIISGFKVQGTDEDEGYYLTGSKWVTLGNMGVDTPKISNGKYKFFDDLKKQMDKARLEVELYMNGKHDEEDDDDDNQLEIPFTKSSASEFDDEE